MKKLWLFGALLCSCIISSVSAETEEEAMARYQAQLNQQVMEAPFDAGNAAKIDAEIKKAMEGELKDKKPTVIKAPTYWRPGYSCRHAYLYGGGWRAYRHCRHYYYYYGRYW